MTDPFDALDSTLAKVWTLLGRGVADRRSAARHPTLATLGPDGPALRTVVLRGVDRSRATVEVHTDLRSAKVSHLKRDPRCEIHVWDAKADLQIRVRCLASIASGEDVSERFARIPEPARRVYGGVLSPGEVLATPGDHEVIHDPTDQYFCVLTLAAQRIETLHLGTGAHRRAAFDVANGWVGCWLVP